MSDANVDQVAKLGCSWTHRPQSHGWCRGLIPVTSCDSFQCRAFFPEVFLGSAALSPTSPWKWSKFGQRYGAKIRSGKTWCFQSLGTKFCDDGVDFFLISNSIRQICDDLCPVLSCKHFVLHFLHSVLSGSAMMKSSAIMAVVTVCTAVVALVQDLWLRAAILFGLLSEEMGSSQGSFVRWCWKGTKRSPRSRSSHMMTTIRSVMYSFSTFSICPQLSIIALSSPYRFSIRYLQYLDTLVDCEHAGQMEEPQTFAICLKPRLIFPLYTGYGLLEVKMLEQLSEPCLTLGDKCGTDLTSKIWRIHP